MSRGFTPIAACAVLAVVLAGCDWTSMTASDMREPVLLGPVACIGCAAKPTEPTTALPSHVGAHRRSFLLVDYFSLRGDLMAESHPIGVSLDRVLYWTPCRDDVHLSNVRARAWQLSVPLLYFQSDVSIEADATPVPVAGATCSPLR
jgi:hypothetical protein